MIQHFRGFRPDVNQGGRPLEVCSGLMFGGKWVAGEKEEEPGGGAKTSGGHRGGRGHFFAATAPSDSIIIFICNADASLPVIKKPRKYHIRTHQPPRPVHKSGRGRPLLWTPASPDPP